MPASRQLRFVLCAVASALLCGSCAQLGLPPLNNVPAAVPLSPPSVTFLGATLVRAPSMHDLAAHYCPEVVQAPFGAAPLLCQQAFGPPPPLSALVVSFDLRFRVANPNQVPLPLASALVATTLFPATTGQQLGAVCVALCPEGSVGCTGAPPPGACEASSRDVRSLNDFVDKSLPQLLIANASRSRTASRPSSRCRPSLRRARPTSRFATRSAPSSCCP